MADGVTPNEHESAGRVALPSQVYRSGAETGRWQADPLQESVLPVLDRLHRAVSTASRRTRPRWPRWFRRDQANVAPKGLYLWGQVGRGKTFLLDLLAEHLPPGVAYRRHFHRFMGEVHERLRQLRAHGQRDPLTVVAADLAARCKLLCLDEFVVLDIGDAMLLSGLLEALFERGVALATTSNSPPHDLYRDGLQRARFLPATALLERQCDVVELTSPTDYRLRSLTRAPVYRIGPDEHTDADLSQRFAELAPGGFELDGVLPVEDRDIPTRGLADGVAWFDFAALCEGARASADYIELARSFNTVLIGRVPQLGSSARDDAARRFIHLVDEFYDRKVKLLIGAQVEATSLYPQGRLRNAFERTESRLIEMQSRHYLTLEHHP